MRRLLDGFWRLKTSLWAYLAILKLRLFDLISQIRYEVLKITHSKDKDSKMYYLIDLYQP